LELHASLKSGVTMSQLSDEHVGSFLRYGRNIREYRLVHAPVRQWVVDVRVLWGATGTGKTRTVYDSHEIADIYCHGGGPWFDGYDQHSICLFDDFGGSCFPLPYLLKLLDRYPFRVPIKGGFVAWVPKIIYITSNMDPDTWYAGALPEHQRALRRRFTTVQHFSDFFQ